MVPASAAPIASPTLAPITTPTVVPSVAFVSNAPVAFVCRSISYVSDEWCRGVACAPVYSDFCTWGLPDTIPTVVPVTTPTLPPVETTYVGIYDWTWVSGNPSPPTGSTLGVAFSGWADVTQALSDRYGNT